MRTYLISYDLAGLCTNHRLPSEIMQLGEAWARPLECTWLVRTAERRQAVESRMRPLLAGEDGLLIQEVESETLLVNTALRWFKKRRQDVEASSPSSVIAFPSESMATCTQVEAA